MPNDRTWNYFTDKEVDGLDKEFVAALDNARHLSGIPFIITSGIRTQEQNQAVGGVENSSHITGHAVDLRINTSVECFKIVRGLMDSGIARIIIGINIDSSGTVAYHNIHADNDPTKPQNVLAIKLYP